MNKKFDEVVECREPYGKVVLEHFKLLADFVNDVNTLTSNKLYSIADLDKPPQAPQESCCMSLDIKYPEYFNDLRQLYFKIYNSILSIQNTINSVEL